MDFPKCGIENPDDATVYGSYGVALPKAFVATKYPVPRTSVLAILALAFGIMSLFTYSLTIIPAIILGIISIVIIEKSGGRRTGRGFAIIGIVFAILMLGFVFIFWPQSLKVRRTSYALVCGTHLSGIGKTMQIYANDYDDKYPRSGGINSTWSNNIPNWKASNKYVADGLKAGDIGGHANISSCFYLLVKYAGITPESFICPGDSGAREFNPTDYNARDTELIDLWNFGPEPQKHCSYSYHMPFSQYALTKSSERGMAVAADRNPWQDSPAETAKSFPDSYNPDGGKEAIKYGNAIAHQEKTQNVLFVDCHVGQQNRSFCGINDDNIYTYWDGGDIRIGAPPVVGSEPKGDFDSLLVNDGP
jgi:prepilin-type processing-associated H-X9-DG protein